MSGYRAILLVALLAACAPRGELGYTASPDQAEQIETVFVATSRAKEAGGGFGGGRSKTLSFASYEVSIPNAREPGSIKWPSGLVDPDTDFAIADQDQLASITALKTQVERTFLEPGAVGKDGKREVTVFIHGFNTNFAEALYRVAQIRHDYRQKAPMVLYSWPSAANPRLYVYDRDSVLFARNGLAELLNGLARSRVDKISLVAHSMGANLLMETLRQIYQDSNSPVPAKIVSVVLISPDIDIDLFNQQVSTLEPLPEQFVVLGSGKDKALRFLRFLAGKPSRVGNNVDPDRVEDDRITVYNLTEFAGGQGLGHFILADSAALIELINRLDGDASDALPKFQQLLDR